MGPPGVLKLVSHGNPVMKTLQDIRRKRRGDDRHALVEGYLLCRRISWDAGGLSLVTAGGCSSAEVSSQDVSLGLVSCATPSWHNDHSQDAREVRSQDSQACMIRRNSLQAEFYKTSGCHLIFVYEKARLAVLRMLHASIILYKLGSPRPRHQVRASRSPGSFREHRSGFVFLLRTLECRQKMKSTVFMTW